MNKIKKIIIKEMEYETPNVLNKILMNCEGKKMKNNKISFNTILSYAVVAIVAFVIGIVGYNQYNKMYIVDAVVELDVNPSVELKISKSNKVVEANALNNDGEKILQDINLKNSDLKIAIYAIVGSMYKNGYISDLKNSILVSVNSNNFEKNQKLQSDITKEIDNILGSYNIESAILTQSYNANDKTTSTDGISSGKKEFIEKILKSDLTNKNGEKYTSEDLANLNINELNVILNSKNKTVDQVKSTGNASTKSYIGSSKAKEIALNDAKASSSSIRDFSIELDYEYGKMIYEVDFDYNNNEYEYEIDAVNGNIIHKSIEKDDDYVKNSNNTSTNSTQSNKTSTKSTQSNTNSNYISRSKAKSIAIKNSGVKESSVRNLSIELDKENGKMIYEVEFESGKYEYEYEIDAINGKIINKKKELDD